MEKLIYLALGALGYHLYQKHRDGAVDAVQNLIGDGQEAARDAIQGAAQQAVQAATPAVQNAQDAVFKITDPIMQEFLRLSPLSSVSMTDQANLEQLAQDQYGDSRLWMAFLDATLPRTPQKLDNGSTVDLLVPMPRYDQFPQGTQFFIIPKELVLVDQIADEYRQRAALHERFLYERQQAVQGLRTDPNLIPVPARIRLVTVRVPVLTR